MVNPKDKAYFQHILDAIDLIGKYLNGKAYEDFSRDQLLQDGVVRELEIIGEAVKNISDDFKKENPEIKWKKAAGMRDKLIHDYFSVDIKAVWETAHGDIAELKSALREKIK